MVAQGVAAQGVAAQGVAARGCCEGGWVVRVPEVGAPRPAGPGRLGVGSKTKTPTLNLTRQSSRQP